MFNFLERTRLIKKGLACNKQRRRQSSGDLRRILETGLKAKLLIFALFLAGLATVVGYGAPPETVKQFLLGFLIFMTAVAQLWINHPQTFASNSKLLLVFGTMLVHLGMIKLLLLLAENQTIDYNLAILLLPYAFAPLALSALLGKNHGLFAAIFVSLWTAILLEGINPELLVTSLISGFIAVYVTLQVRRRSRLIRAGIYVGLATWILALAFGIIWIDFASLASTNWTLVGTQSLAAIGAGVLTAMLVGGALPALENCFSITTDISWLEMADLNHPLLKRMTMEAPGTYHHSLVVASLAETAAEAIEANATMTRVCAYFHDIGKLVKPEYFAENIHEGRNPHDDLAPTMSALIIISHVKEGVDLALQYKLNREIIEIIQQHHGTSLVYYFYKRALQQQEDAREGGKIMNMREEDIPEVREESFRYKGPRPQFKESGIISLADAVESTSRSLGKPTPQRIEQMIDEIFEQRIADGQLDDCDLTLRELRIIAERFRFTLQNMMHSRVAYPKESKEEAPPDPGDADRRGKGTAEAV